MVEEIEALKSKNSSLREEIESMLLVHAKKEGAWLDSLKTLLEENKRLRDALQTTWNEARAALEGK
jgi:hypothetical protein